MTGVQTCALPILNDQGRVDRGTGTDYQTILHELIHTSATLQQHMLGEYAKKYGKADPIYHEFEDLLSKIRSAINKDMKEDGFGKEHRDIQRNHKTYFKNQKELLAYGLTDENVQKYLAKIKVGEQSALTKLFDLVRRLLGIDPQYKSALESLLDLTDKLYSESAASIESKVGKLGYGFKPKSRVSTSLAGVEETIDENFSANRLVKNTKAESAGEKIKNAALGVYNNVQDDKYRTGLRVNWIDKNSGVAKTLSELPIFDTKGQLRADMLLRSQGQMINLIRNGLQTGEIVVNTDGTLVVKPTENNLARKIGRAHV